eukprot:CAMPEP_0113566930 /NCGR_PEP_ID=MMETSP0015_2-20120614/22995_1 /TAXON_ID=2838 /ORGANISM="Odontella" /LENGTH=601 /DNA_ID=CAMNT_0000469271 /DNA_START=79 /DNA_END=1884 /DNA_ORIENTATION=- /assembly_acc=CAM_ASM_000160
MVLYGNNYNIKGNKSTAVLVALAAVIVTLIWNTVTDIQASNGDGEQAYSLDAAGVALLVLAGALLVLIAVGILFTIISAHIWPVEVKDLFRVLAEHPGSLLELANKCNRCGRDFWSIKSKLFWGERTLILTSEKSVRDVLIYNEVFERTMPNPEASVTSCHTVLGAPGGGSAKWKRLRTVCSPFFDNAEFESRTQEVIEHIIAAVKAAIKNAPMDGIDYFQLINRLVVEIHLLLILGVKTVASDGMVVQNPMVEKGNENDSVMLADTIDDSLNIGMQGHAPSYTSNEFAPLLNYLTERLQLPASELGGIERILCEAQKNGEVTSIERLHNLCMYMIALAPSPASFWLTTHVFLKESLLNNIREEADCGNFTKLSFCFKETLRMYAPVPIMIQRYVVNEETANHVCLLEGSMALKKGDHVVIPTIIMQNDPTIWVKPDEFRPERWDDGEVISSLENNKDLKIKMRRGSGIEKRPVAQEREVMKARYFPFGMGQHTCLGQPYAVWLTMTVASTIINNFDVELSDPEEIMELKPSYKRIRDHIYSFPKHPLRAKITAINTPCATRRSMAFRKSMASGIKRVSMFVGGDMSFQMALMKAIDDEED